MRHALVAMMILAGCGTSAPKGLDVYTYSVPVEQDPMSEYWIGSDYTLRIGTTNYTVKNGEVAVPKDVWLTKNPLMLVLDSTCGAHEVPLKNVYSDEKEMRQSAAKYKQRVQWKLEPTVAFEAKNIGVVVDNLENSKPVTVRLGTLTRQIAANTHDRLGGLLGACETAREIVVDGKVLGVAKTDGASTLVDALGTRCYETARDSYGAMPIPSERDELVAYAPGLYTIGRIDNWFVPNPTSTTVRVRDTESAKASAGTTLTSLTHATCPTRAARRR